MGMLWKNAKIRTNSIINNCVVKTKIDQMYFFIESSLERILALQTIICSESTEIQQYCTYFIARICDACQEGVNVTT